MIRRLLQVLTGWRSRGLPDIDDDRATELEESEFQSAQTKQNELIDRLRSVVDHVQAISGRTDILWHEYERRQRMDPTYLASGAEERRKYPPTQKTQTH